MAILNDLGLTILRFRFVRSLVLGGLTVCAALLEPRPANAENTGPVIEVTGQCPQRAQVVSSILGTLPAPYSQSENAAKISVHDHGDRYEVSTGTNKRTYLDASLQCEERARTVAIFVTLELRPPQVANDETVAKIPTVSPPVAIERSIVVETITQPGPWGASVAMVAESAGVDLSTLGLDLRGLWQPWNVDSSWSVGVGLGLRSSATIEATAPYRASLIRLPADLSVRRRWSMGVMSPFAELGFAIAASIVEGLSPLERTQTELRLDPGFRAFLGTQWRLGEQRAFAGLGATTHPWPLLLNVAPEQQVAQTPGLWLFVSAGLMFFGGPT